MSTARQKIVVVMSKMLKVASVMVEVHVSVITVRSAIKIKLVEEMRDMYERKLVNHRNFGS